MHIQKYFEFRESDLNPIESFRIKDTLNLKIWDDFELKRDIREDLLKIGEDFYHSTELKADVVDIVLCGSLCNYNWSEKYSDYDLHIIINFKQINEDLEIVEKLCDLSKKLWNQQHDIKIKGYDVEVAIQDKKDLNGSIKAGRMGGVFSLLNDKWIKKPEKVEFVPDEKLISEKGKSIMLEIDDLIESEDIEYEELRSRIKKVWDKIKKLRERSLEEEGEYGIGNLIFKLLRRNNYLGKIMDLKRNAYDKQFESLNEHSDGSILKLLYEIDLINSRLEENNYEGSSSYIDYEIDEEFCRMTIEMGASGYSDGWSEIWKIDYSDPEYIVVDKNSSYSNPYGSGNDEKKIKLNSFNELLEELKEQFQ